MAEHFNIDSSTWEGLPITKEEIMDDTDFDNVGTEEEEEESDEAEE